jgi:hypothetical protein
VCIVSADTRSGLWHAGRNEAPGLADELGGKIEFRPQNL